MDLSFLFFISFYAKYLNSVFITSFLFDTKLRTFKMLENIFVL